MQTKLFRWTDNEIEIVRKYFPNIEKIKKYINRSEESIKLKAHRNGIYSNITYLKLIDNIWYERVPLEIRAYLAGVFDGEGCIRFRKKHKTFAPIVTIQMCCKDILLLFQKYFNGRKFLKEINNGKNKQMYRWDVININDLYNLCKAIEPFSIEKNPQIKLVIEHIEEYRFGNRTHPTDRLREKTKERASLCKQLKSVGW